MLLGVSQWHSILINDSKHQKKALMLGNVARYINIQHNFYTFLKWIIIILVLMKVEHFSFGRDRKGLPRTQCVLASIWSRNCSTEFLENPSYFEAVLWHRRLNRHGNHLRNVMQCDRFHGTAWWHRRFHYYYSRIQIQQGSQCFLMDNSSRSWSSRGHRWFVDHMLGCLDRRFRMWTVKWNLLLVTRHLCQVGLSNTCTE